MINRSEIASRLLAFPRSEIIVEGNVVTAYSGEPSCADISLADTTPGWTIQKIVVATEGNVTEGISLIAAETEGVEMTWENRKRLDYKYH